MRATGHDVRVLCSQHLRFYSQEPDAPRIGTRARLRVERHNLATLDCALDEFGPDVVNWWPLGGMSVSLIERVHRRGVPAAGVISDDWLVYCMRSDMWAGRFGRRGRARLAEALTGVPTRVDLGAAGSWLFNSDYIRARALVARSLPDTAVAHPGIETARFAPVPERDKFGWRLLYLGRIDRRKGIDTAMEALAELPEHATLSIVGRGDEAYAGELQRMSARLGVDGRVEFAEVERDGVPAAYARADVVVFPVRWDEPWGLVPLEAMAVGTPVVATGTGGSAEYLRDGENCLVFERDGSAALAAAVRRLAEDPDLRARLRAGGIATAARNGEDSYNRAVVAAVERAGTR
jgi:glycosyltransferase involved in cell wall biosynthesis